MKKELVKFLVLLLVALGAGPVGAAMWQWSTTASTNATADPTINWAEGMSPSSVNDSARAMMAATAAWRNDISTSLTSAGSSTAYTLTTSEGLTATPATGQMLAFIAHATNGTAPTMTVDGGTSFPLQSQAGVALPAGTLILGTPYRMGFNGTAWLMEGQYANPFSVPLGGLLPSTVATPPNSSFILPAGQCISTTTYAAYWVAMGSPASGGCAGGNFAVLDLRGRIPIPLDNLNGTGASRITSAGCGVALTSIGAICTPTETFTLITSNLPAYTPSGSLSLSSGSLTGTANFGGAPIISGAGSGVGGGGAFGVTGGTSVIVSGTPTGTFSGSAQGGSSAAISRISPAIGVSYFLRVL